MLNMYMIGESLEWNRLGRVNCYLKLCMWMWTWIENRWKHTLTLQPMNLHIDITSWINRKDEPHYDNSTSRILNKTCLSHWNYFNVPKGITIIFELKLLIKKSWSLLKRRRVSPVDWGSSDLQSREWVWQ